ncbi:DUF2255 family protein [Streptomyces sp. WMMC500]|uniref:DUF2255 family protein n=1 Tax=Streptomyces sp. WMMC500 TaxID=3015154 RepID=UPI00248B1A15|nr:DUF2255 family protein [Streptomyces sp. WMMC500]WBB63807.1 DUF2255 family protein [Streptomyces sp. WMMC500]
MAAWTADELDRIGTAEELNLQSQRGDGSLRDPVTMWVVRDGDDVYVRSVKGSQGPWFRGTRARLAGRIRAGGVDKDVAFVDVGDPGETTPRVDEAYRTKYGHYPADIFGSVVTPQAKEATIRLVPR